MIKRYFSRAPNLTITEVPDGIAVSDPSTDTLHVLNQSARLVFELCGDGHDTLSIGDIMMQRFALPTPPVDDIARCVSDLQQMGLLIETSA